MKVLVPVDGSSYTRRMLAYLVAHDEWFDAQQQLTVLHVSPAVPARPASVVDQDVLRAYYAEESEKVFKPIRAFLAKQKLPARFLAKVGPAADVIADAAKRGRFGLVVMGSHGHGALSGLVLGSVTTRVLARCRTPVLIVR